MDSQILEDDQGPAVLQVCMIAGSSAYCQYHPDLMCDSPFHDFVFGQAAQDGFVDGQDTSKDVQDLPESPGSDNEWEVVEATVGASDCGSSAK